MCPNCRDVRMWGENVYLRISEIQDYCSQAKKVKKKTHPKLQKVVKVWMSIEL